MPNKKKTKKAPVNSPRIAHVDFMVERERQFVKYVKYLSNPVHIMWRNFLVGTFQGVGFILGTAVLLTVAAYITNKITGASAFFSDFTEAVGIWLESTLESSQ